MRICMKKEANIYSLTLFIIKMPKLLVFHKIDLENGGFFIV